MTFALSGTVMALSVWPFWSQPKVDDGAFTTLFGVSLDATSKSQPRDSIVELTLTSTLRRLALGCA